MRYAAFCLCLLLSPLAHAEDEFQPLFNGKDLTGWDGDPEIWSVEDGLLTGQTKEKGQIKGNTFLIWKDGEVGDFELKVVFRLEGDNNSGVQYRSQKSKDKRKWGIVGYQADIHPAVNYTAMLYDEGGRGIVAERAQQVTLDADGKKTVKTLEGEWAEVDLGEWNELVITAEGDHLVHKLNGQVTVDITDRDKKDAEAKGLLALQVHAGEPMKIQFKSVELKQLGKEDKKAKKQPISLDSASTPADKIKVLDGFKVELLYSVPKPKEGSWVNLCVDPKGRLIVSDQYGDLYRVTVPPVGETGETKVERIPVELGQAQGLLWAFDSLYVVVNGESRKFTDGLYRVRDTNGDDQLDSVERLRELQGKGEHGPHAVLLTPDGKSLFVVCGNNTKFTNIDSSRVPQLWDEDQLLPRIYGVGFMKGTPPPAGCIYKIDPDGKEWELISSGFRNEFDAAVNADGELFTYDADMEWDFGTPWYRPTRVCHVVSGADWGWRNGSAKWPVHFSDTLPPVVDLGPGSPTGVTFGYGAKFPAAYQKALFLCDWTYGKLYAVHMTPRGASYGGTIEEFATATPLPLTDVIINPHDGAMYFTIGGRKVQSGLYRITYIGKESTAPVNARDGDSPERTILHKLAAFHHGPDPQAVEAAWPYLNHADRFIRGAARTALEHQPVETWQERALSETDPQAAMTALLALSRTVPRSFKPTGAELDTPPPTFPADDAERHPLEGPVLAALDRIEWSKLSNEQKLELLRCYQVALYRLGAPDEPTRVALIKRFDAIYPADGREQNAMLTEIMCYLQAPSAAAKGIKLLAESPTQEGQLDIVRSLRFLEAGWTPETRRELFEWFLRGLSYKGGVNFANFVQEIKANALARLPESEKVALDSVINAPVPDQVTPLSAKPRPLVKEWKMEEVIPLVEQKLHHRNFDRGRQMFAEANCFGCHRFASEGGAMGPDLTILSGRFSARDILESVMEPDKVISDQYAAVVAVTAEGKVVTGRVVNYNGNEIQINTNMLDPNAIEKLDRRDVEEMNAATTSMMPAGLLNTLNEEELLDLMAFLLSRGDRKHEMFAP